MNTPLSAIDFIERDIAKTQWHWKTTGVFSILFSISACAIGLGMRGDLIEAFYGSNLLPPVLMLLMIAIFPWIYVSARISLRSKQTLLLIFLVAAMGLSLIQPQTSVSLRKFEGLDRFWPEALHCLWLGLASSFLASIALSLATSQILPTPNRRWRVIYAVVSGTFGLAVLTFHCMGPLRTHTMIAHWGQAALIFPIAYFQQDWLIRWKMKKLSGKNPAIQNLSRLS